MVVGLERFSEHFRDFQENYVLIGGAACFLVMDNAGLQFRATKDLDLVLVAEALDEKFVTAFWEFVRTGQYEIQEKSTGEKQCYRFRKPQVEQFPFMLELFSRHLPQFSNLENGQLTPIPIDEDVSSLSAILMGEDYYQFLRSGKTIINGIQIAGAEHLIPLKARAWLDLSDRKRAGRHVNARDIKKHKLDVFRLMAIVDPEFAGDIPQQVKQDIDAFIDAMAEETIDMKNVGLKGQQQEDILAEIARIYLNEKA